MTPSGWPGWRVRHAELPEARSFDDAEYHLAIDVPAATHPGQQLAGTLWRFGAESPDGRKLEDAVRVEIQREDRIAPVMARGLAYRAMGTLERLYLVHAGTGFAQVIRVMPASALEIPPGGIAVRGIAPPRRPPPASFPASTRRSSSAKDAPCE